MTDRLLLEETEEFTGERYLPTLDWPEISYEHWHRYLLAGQFATGKRVLDVASGEGYGGALLAEQAQLVVGVDANPSAVAHATRTYRAANLKFLAGRAESLPITDHQTFDLAVSFETIEHLTADAQHGFLREVKRLLKHDGLLLVSTPNKATYTDAAHYHNSFHLKEFYAPEFEELLKQYFKHVDLLGQRVYPTSYLWPLSGNSSDLSEHQLGFDGVRYTPHRDDRKEVLYIVAICADRPLEPAHHSLLLDISDRAMRGRLQQLEAAQETVEALRHERDNQTALEMDLRQDLALRETAWLELGRATERSTFALETLSEQLTIALGELQQAREDRQALRTTVAAQTRELKLLTRRLAGVEQQQAAAQARFQRTEQHLLRAIDSVQAQLYEFESTAGRPSAVGLTGTEATGQPIILPYAEVIQRTRELVYTSLPREAKILVVSKGDRALLDLYGRVTGHFPQTAEGVYAGYHPRDGRAAVAHLEALRALGWEYLLLPATMLWWLDHYVELRQHLDRNYRRVTGDATGCAIYALLERPTAGSVWSELERLLALCESGANDQAAVLDWHTGFDLATRISTYAVFSPPTDDATLPYLDKTIDLVVRREAGIGSIGEAERVARLAVLEVEAPTLGNDDPLIQAVHWCGAALTLPSVSLLLPARLSTADQGWIISLASWLQPGLNIELVFGAEGASNDLAAHLKQLWPELRLRTVSGRGSYGAVAHWNRAAAAADGEVLVFLDRGVVPLPGWLPAILGTLRTHSDAGAIGTKVLDPEGNLLQAGGAIFADGSTIQIGAGELNPDAPLFSYVRVVDWSGGPILATPRAVFKAVGAFDPSYRSGVYAQVDFCLRLVDRDLVAYYQPDAVVVDVRPVAAELAAGPTPAEVVADRLGCLDRWRTVLAQRGQRPRQPNQDGWRRLVTYEPRQAGWSR